ncbi:MAG: glycosyltransferase family 1 protein [Candidatus Hydrogenedentes bacterium]|nr:glycosyltransferase family 1 protein [Candidatus Hydrogenedentota bacterium]
MFRHPLYFVHHNVESWADVCFADCLPTQAEYGKRLRHGNDNWVLQTYLELKRRGLNVNIVPRPVPGQICVAHYDDILLKEMPTRCFLVGIRGDRPNIHVSQINIVQNQFALRHAREFFMPHWSQPGLIPRDTSRGHTIRKVGYMGMRFNLHPAFLDPRFLRRLEESGVALEVREYPFQDYSDIDLVLAVRPGTPYDIDLKPATKLQNAWLAGCPALLGPESGYRQFRQSDLDYIEIQSPEHALHAIRTLQQNARHYTEMIENGRARGAEFTHDKIAERWINFLAGPVTDAYERWLTSHARLRWLDYARFTVCAAQHKLARYRHLRKL